MMKNKKGTEHLHKYIVEQDSASYTPVEQATWRFILRLLADYFKDNAHPFYFTGLKAAGISTEHIPSIQSMREALSEYGWKTVPVSGFIPPAAFLEMQSLGFLPVAKEIRSIHHIPYTPAPDIIHEAAGHAPYLAHPEFSDYLHKYAEIAKKSIISSEDFAVYSAIRILSDVKEHPNSSAEEISAANEELERALAAVSYVSEAAKASRLYWWTAEYGLVGEMSNPKIYGAGLLSSLGEAKKCLNDKVKKLPLNIDCINYNFNITEPQPQLFVSPDFVSLKNILEEMAASFSFRRGGKFGFNEALRAKTINTVELDSGLQISGKFVSNLEYNDTITYIKADGPSQLSYKLTELPGHSNTYHKHGYSSILERPVGATKALYKMTRAELASLGVEENKSCNLSFPSGIKLKGNVSSITFMEDKALIITLDKCSITKGDEVLFAPEWGSFDWGLGEEIRSVFSGPADFPAFGDFENFHAIIIKPKHYSEEDISIHGFYQKIRDLRENFKKDGNLEKLSTEATELYTISVEKYPKEWLAKAELYELFLQLDSKSEPLSHLKRDLEDLAARDEDLSMHIHDFFAIAKHI